MKVPSTPGSALSLAHPLALVSGAILALSMLSMVGGCSSNASSSSEVPQTAAAASSPSAVTVDFYSGANVSAACAGTLISANVVLTAAHCADNSVSARVRAPAAGGSSGQTSEATDVLRYDWGRAIDHSQEHDVALVVLRTPITLPTYPTVSGGACLGCSAVVYGRAGALTTKSGAFEIANQSPVGRPFALQFKGTPAGAVGGGGVFAGDGTLVGVYMGQGTSTSNGYVARFDLNDVQIWLSSVVSQNGGAMETTSPEIPLGSIKAQSVKILSTGGGTGGASATNSNTDGSNDAGDPSENIGDSGSDPNGDDSSGTDQSSTNGAPAGYDPKGQGSSSKPPAAKREPPARITGSARRREIPLSRATSTTRARIRMRRWLARTAHRGR